MPTSMRNWGHAGRANVDRVNGAARLLDLLGDPESSPAIPPRLSVFTTCPHFIEQIPAMVHSPTRSEDVLKVDCDDQGRGGDDAYDAGRYGLMVDSVGVAASHAVPATDPVAEMDGSRRMVKRLAQSTMPFHDR